MTILTTLAAFGICLTLSSTALGKVFNGDGDIIFTYDYSYLVPGVRVIYRPENYKTYSVLGKGETAQIYFERYDSKDEAESSYDDDILSYNSFFWYVMIWDSDGKYYYYDQSSGAIDTSDWFAYAVEISDNEGEVIYSDTYNYYEVPATLEYCELDEDAYDIETACSEALDGSSGSSGSGGGFSSSKKKKNKKKYKSKSKGRGRGGSIAGWIIFLIIVVCISVALWIFCRRYEGWSRTRNAIANIGFLGAQTAVFPETNGTVTVPVPTFTVQGNENGGVAYNYGVGFPVTVQAQDGAATIEIGLPGNPQQPPRRNKKKAQNGKQQLNYEIDAQNVWDTTMSYGNMDEEKGHYNEAADANDEDQDNDYEDDCDSDGS